MGQDDNLHASLAHIVLGCVASRSISNFSTKSFAYPGMHANFFIHSVLGFLHYQSDKIEKDFGPAYTLSYKATRYLALPSLMADINTDNQNISALYLVSGLVPFALAVGGTDNPHLGNLSIVCNLLALAYYSMENEKEWGIYVVASGLFTYFLPYCMGPKLVYPIGLAVMEYCAYNMLNPPPPPPPRRRGR